MSVELAATLSGLADWMIGIEGGVECVEEVSLSV
jgi:hypothetical protein